MRLLRGCCACSCRSMLQKLLLLLLLSLLLRALLRALCCASGARAHRGKHGLGCVVAGIAGLDLPGAQVHHHRVDLICRCGHSSARQQAAAAERPVPSAAGRGSMACCRRAACRAAAAAVAGACSAPTSSVYRRHGGVRLAAPSGRLAVLDQAGSSERAAAQQHGRRRCCWRPRAAPLALDRVPAACGVSWTRCRGCRGTEASAAAQAGNRQGWPAEAWWQLRRSFQQLLAMMGSLAASQRSVLADRRGSRAAPLISDCRNTRIVLHTLQATSLQARELRHHRQESVATRTARPGRTSALQQAQQHPIGGASS